MMKEVSNNKGMGTNVAQSVEVESSSQDKMTVGKVNPKIIELAEDIGKKYKKEMSEHQPTTQVKPRDKGKESMTL